MIYAVATQRAHLFDTLACQYIANENSLAPVEILYNCEIFRIDAIELEYSFNVLVTSQKECLFIQKKKQNTNFGRMLLSLNI